MAEQIIIKARFAGQGGNYGSRGSKRNNVQIITAMEEKPTIRGKDNDKKYKM